MKNLFSIFTLLCFGCFLSSCDRDELVLTDSQLNQAGGSGVLALSGPLIGAKAYVSSNTSGVVAIFDIEDVQNAVTSRKVNVPHTDSDGIIYESETDAIFQVNRSNNRVEAFSNMASLTDGSSMVPSASSSSDFTNGREATYGLNRIIVVQDAAPSNGEQNAIVVYRGFPNQIQGGLYYPVNIDLWGIQLINDTDLWAVVDNSNKIAVFVKFNRAPEGPLEPTYVVSVEGIVRIHGMHYDVDADVMVLTDIGDASSDTDGAVHVITDFSVKYAAALAGSGIIPLTEQLRMAGPTTRLGNPVDVAYRAATEQIFVAERANGGGQFLVFDVPALSCDAPPVYTEYFEGASAVVIGQ